MAQAARLTLQQGHRTFNRVRLGVPAALILTHERQPCVLENVSATGACIRCAQPVAKGATAVLSFHQLRIYASVTWSREGLCGLRFEKQLDMEDMQGFFWITQNRAEYERICREDLIEDAATGYGR